MDDKQYINERLRDDIQLSAAKRPFRDVVATHCVEELGPQGLPALRRRQAVGLPL
ncbi:hypothetical protein WBP07_21915 (plasmid) [Novosphingobium sp. BL-8A]|uniref:hypothetical protein n=1 Tax=Novosphingobium sp. BL-8A TaxID=3127639 RepID=UPI0037584B2B